MFQSHTSRILSYQSLGSSTSARAFCIRYGQNTVGRPKPSTSSARRNAEFLLGLSGRVAKGITAFGYETY